VNNITNAPNIRRAIKPLPPTAQRNSYIVTTKSIRASTQLEARYNFDTTLIIEFVSNQGQKLSLLWHLSVKTKALLHYLLWS